MSQKKSSQKDDQETQADLGDIEELLEEAREQAASDEAQIPAGGTGGDDDRDEQIASLQDQLGRAQADYQNLVRRMRTEQEELGEFTRSKTVLKFLPMVDNFDRALEHLPEDIADHQWVEGILSLGKTLEKILREFEVGPFTSIGEEVDPDRHDVISTGPGEDGKIIAQIEKGYMIGEKVLRHAKVVVGNGEA